MTSLGPHAFFILASYAAVGIVLALLIGWLAIDGWRQQRMIERLEAEGVGRRSRVGEQADGRQA